MLSLDSIVRQNSGGEANLGTSATFAVSLAGADATEAGNTLIAFFTSGNTGNQQTVATTPPSGWATLTVSLATRIFYRGPVQGLAAGESSWNFTGHNILAGPVGWVVWEVEGLDEALLDAIAGSAAQASSGTTLQSSASGTTSTYEGLAVAAHGSRNDTGTTPDAWGSHTDGFVEVTEVGQAGSADAVSLSVSALPVQQIGSYSTTATSSRAFTANGGGFAFTFVLTAEGAGRAANIYLSDGAEHGLITGNTLGAGTNYKIVEAVTAGVSVASAAARSGSYGWLTSSTSAACNRTMFGLANLAALGTRPPLYRCFRFATLPTVDTVMWTVTTISGTSFVLQFVAATGKLGLKVGAGSEVMSDQAVTANQWFAVHLLPDFRTATYLADWQVDYNAELTDTTGPVVQAQASGSGTAGGSGGLGTYRVGWTAAITAAMHDDDGACGKEAPHYPFGDLRILPVKVDPAGTPSISGTSTNFGVMTANGSVAAWNAANARDAVDDIPPDLSGTRDAAVALLAHASDYAEFPAETVDLAAQGVYVRGVRLVACLWAAAATTATIRLFAYDGVTSYTMFPEADPNADNTATPVWFARQVRPTTGRTDWTQAKLDALAFWFGSNDATPDIGVDAFVFEVAVVKAQQEDLFGAVGDPVHVTGQRDPDTNALIGMDVTTVGEGATVDYEIDEVAQTPEAVAADDTKYVPLGGDDFQSVNRITVTPD